MCTQAGERIASLQAECEELAREKQHLTLKGSQQESRIADLLQQAQAHAGAEESLRSAMQRLRHDADAYREGLEAAQASTRSAEQRYWMPLQGAGGMLSRSTSWAYAHLWLCSHHLVEQRY